MSTNIYKPVFYGPKMGKGTPATMTDDIQVLLELTKQAIQTAKQATEELKRMSDSLQSRIDATNQYIDDMRKQIDIKGD